MTASAVSVVVATYNYGHFLPEALDSILAQTTGDWEAIVVDDGSTDQTPKIVKPYLADRRIKYFRTPHVGQPAAKNFGIQQSVGNLVAFLDADDCWFPTKLEKQLPLFSDDQVAVVYSLRKTMDANGQELVRSQLPVYRGEVLKEIFKDNFVCFSSSVARRDVLQRAGGFSETIPLAIDYELWLRLARDWKFDYVNEPLVWYRTGHANLSRRGYERIQIVLGIMDRCVDDPEIAKRLGRNWINRCYAETFCTVAGTLQTVSRVEQRRWLWRSIRRYPWNLRAFKELLKLSPPISWFRSPPKPPQSTPV